MKLLRLIRLLLLALTLTAVAALAYLLRSESAAPLLLNELSRITQGAIRCDSASGPLMGPIVLEGLVYDDADVRVEVAHARIEWNLFALLAQQLRVHDLQVTQALLVIKRPPPDPVPSDAVTRLPLALIVEHMNIQSFSLQAHDSNAPLRFDAITLSADWTRDLITIKPLLTTYAPVGALQLSGVLRMEPRQLRIERAELLGLGTIQAKGVIGYNNELDAQLNWKDLRWPQQGAALARSPDGSAKLSGTWDRYRFDLNGSVDVQDVPMQLVSHGAGNLNELNFERLEVKALAGSASARGKLAWLPELAIQAKGTVSQLNPHGRWPDWPGKLSGEFALNATWPRHAPDYQFDVNLSDSQLRAYSFSLEARGRYQGDTLRLAQFDLRSGASRLQAQGQATPPFDMQAQLTSPDLANFWPGLEGSAEVSMKLSGNLEVPHLIAHGQVRQARYQKIEIEQASLEADLHPRAASHVDFTARNLNLGLRVPVLELHVDGSAAQNQVEFKTHTEAGDVEAGLRGRLDLKARSWSGQLVSGRGEPVRLSEWKLEEPAGLLISRRKMALEPACWRSRNSRACVQFSQADRQSRLAFRLEDWAFAYFEPFLPPAWTLSGAASGTAVLAFDAAGLREARADLQTTSGQLSVAKHAALSFLPSSLHVAEESTGLIAQLRLPLEHGGVNLDATLAPAALWQQRALSGRALLDFSDLTPLRLLTPEIEAASGKLHGEFELSGSAGHPRTQGALQLAGGRLRLSTPGIELSDVQAQLQSDVSTGRIVLGASASSGGGTLKLEGQTDPEAETRTLSLALIGANFLAANTPQARVWVSPDLRFTLARGRADLTGEVSVPRAEITPATFDQGAGPSSDQVILDEQGQAPEPGLLKIYSNVRLSLGDDVRFDGFGLKTRLQGAINASDEPGRPTQARGEVRLIGGRYKAYGQDLSVETGRLLFNGGLITDPAVELRAVRKPEENVTVGIYVRGTLDAPEFSLYSTPAMPQEQQLSWLVLGRGIEQSSNASDRSTLSSAALSLGLGGGGLLAQRLGGGLKLDEVSIQSRPGQTADQAQFIIGKYLSPKLYISYGVGLFQPGHSFRLRYDIGGHFKLATESGVESGGDLLYSIER